MLLLNFIVIRKMLVASLASLLAFSLPLRAEASGKNDAIGTVLAVIVTQAQARRALNYMDGEGRQELLEEYKKSEGVEDDYGMNAMLGRIMGRMNPIMLRENPSLKDKPYNYFVNRQDYFNAFCAIGNNLSVNRGVFDFCQHNEDEVAAVVAHELGHGQKRHPQSGAKKTLNLLIAREMLTMGASQGTTAVVGLAANHIKASGITKPKEKEADNLSFGYMAAAGYNVGAPAAVWQRILDKQDEVKKDFFAALLNPSTHPGTKWRRDNFSHKLTEYSNGQVSVEAETGAVKVKGHVFMKPASYAGMSGLERAYLIAGRLARLCREDGAVLTGAVADGGAVKIKGAIIVAPGAGDPDAATLAAKLNGIGTAKPTAEKKQRKTAEPA
ncbi:MAG: M48 family metallopeptidase [Acidaminococcales bacterium]|jgi:predicted Zn-dependent protease|nr:M48 family metallopeptidase [Acidaminococcales bacterium]